MNKPTIHNPTNFDPANYEINGYFDNTPPRYIFGMPKASYKEIKEQWEMERDELFPEGNFHQCQHCGNRNVRFVVSCLHEPTGKNICLGDICVARLNFSNYDAFQAARLRSEAAANAKAYKLGLKREAFLKDHSDLKEALDTYNANPEKFKTNQFANNIVQQFNTWANLTERQIAAFIKSLTWENKFEKMKEQQRQNSQFLGAIGERREFTATIKYTKIFDEDGYNPRYYGMGPKQMTVLEDKMGNVLIYWNHLGNKDETVTFKATIKKHNLRDGVKQTILSRAKLI
jgi:hypothetical protein